MLLNLLEERASSETAAEASKGVDWSSVLDTVVNWLTHTGIKIVIAVAVLLISFAIINAVTKKIYKTCQKKHADETISRVATQSARIALKVLVLVCLIAYLGFEVAAISAVISSIGIGISLAVQGTLGNFAGGVIIIVMRPFKIGDYISSNGQEGTVEDIKLFYTHIVTNDNRAVVIPNGTLANNVIVNASAKDTRRVDIVTQVAYGSDVKLVKELIKKACDENELAFKDPAPFVEMSELNESSLDFTVRVWCNRPDYWTVKFALLDAIKKAFDENGIEVPFRQLDVHVKDEAEAVEN